MWWHYGGLYDDGCSSLLLEIIQEKIVVDRMLDDLIQCDQVQPIIAQAQ